MCGQHGHFEVLYKLALSTVTVHTIRNNNFKKLNNSGQLSPLQGPNVDGPTVGIPWHTFVKDETQAANVLSL